MTVLPAYNATFELVRYPIQAVQVVKLVVNLYLHEQVEKREIMDIGEIETGIKRSLRNHLWLRFIQHPLH